MKEILLLTPPECEYGFALAGVRHQVLEGAHVWETLQEACADPGIGVIAVEARLLESLDEHRLNELTERWPGVMVTLPAPAGLEQPPRDELQRLVRRALGYHVRLET